MSGDLMPQMLPDITLTTFNLGRRSETFINLDHYPTRSVSGALSSSYHTHICIHDQACYVSGTSLLATRRYSTQRKCDCAL